MLAKPKFEVRNQSLVRSHLVLQTLRSIPSGGTAFDIQQRFCSLTGDRISIMPVKECLKLLANLDLVSREETSSGFWWTVNDPIQATEPEAAAECS